MTSDDRELPDRDVLRYNVSLYDSLMDLNEAVDTAKTVMSAWSDRLAVCIVTTTVGVVQQRIEESKPEYHYSVKQAETPEPLDEVTHVSVAWDRWPNGGYSDLPQWKTQMDKVDYGQ